MAVMLENNGMAFNGRLASGSEFAAFWAWPSASAAPLAMLLLSASPRGSNNGFQLRCRTDQGLGRPVWMRIEAVGEPLEPRTT